MGEPSPGRWTTRELLKPGNINWQELSKRSPSQHQNPAPPNSQQAPVLDASCQTTSKTGTQNRPLAHRLSKVILSSQTPQNLPLDVALSKRGTRSSSTQQNAGTSHPPPRSLHKALDQTHPLGADTRSKRNYNYAACRKETPNTLS